MTINLVFRKITSTCASSRFLRNTSTGVVTLITVEFERVKLAAAAARVRANVYARRINK